MCGKNKVIFIRHGKTYGNTLRRYIGKTDEQLCPEGIEELRRNTYPECDIVIASPMKRCIQTADIIYPDKEKLVCEELCECDFGDFEGKSYAELDGSKEYQLWVDSGGRLPFPNGESVDEFKRRCIRAFEEITDRLDENEIAAFVVHGGNIMSIFEKYAVPHRDYYSYMLGNGEYYVTEYDGKLKIIGE